MAKPDETQASIVSSKTRRFRLKKRYVLLVVVIIVVVAAVYFIAHTINNRQAANTDNSTSAAIEKSREQTVYVSPPKDVDKGDRQALIDKYYAAAMTAKKAGKADEAKDNATKFLGLVLDDPQSMKKNQSHVADMIKLTGKKAAVIKNE